jgi:hypothetical protein
MRPLVLNRLEEAPGTQRFCQNRIRVCRVITIVTPVVDAILVVDAANVVIGVVEAVVPSS